MSGYRVSVLLQYYIFIYLYNNRKFSYIKKFFIDLYFSIGIFLFYDGDGGYGILMIFCDDGVCEVMLYYDCVLLGCDVEFIYCIWDLYNMKFWFRVISYILLN